MRPTILKFVLAFTGNFFDFNLQGIEALLKKAIFRVKEDNSVIISCLALESRPLRFILLSFHHLFHCFVFYL